MKGVEGGASGVYQLSLCKPMRGTVELVSKERIEYLDGSQPEKKKITV